MIKDVKTSLKAVLFDLDGTLADSSSALKKVYFEFLACQNLAGSQQEFSKLAGPSIAELLEIIRARYSLTEDATLLEESYLTLLENEYANNIPPLQGADALLSWLYTSGISLGLVTSAPTKLVNEFLTAQEWDYLFEAVNTGDSVASAKPNPQMYMQTLEDLGVVADRAIAIENSVNGVKAAINAGLRVIGISANEAISLQNAGAYKTVPNLSAIKELLRSEQYV